MRLQLTFLKIPAMHDLNPKSEDYVATHINKHAFQGLLYKLLQDTEFSRLHDARHSKLFSFSDWLPAKNKKTAKIFVSTPVPSLFKTLESSFRKQKGVLEFKGHVLLDAKIVKQRVWHEFQTVSPIVLVWGDDDRGRQKYYSFREGMMGVYDFEQMIREGAIRRYRAVKDEPDFNVEESLFEEMSFKREVAVPISKNGRKFPVIGSEWSLLKFRYDRSLRGFYEWLIDAGLGQKCSLGFGFIQNLPASPLHDTRRSPRNRTLEAWKIADREYGVTVTK